MPFAPALAVGAVVGVIWGSQIINAWLPGAQLIRRPPRPARSSPAEHRDPAQQGSGRLGACCGT